jgi:chitinase
VEVEFETDDQATDVNVTFDTDDANDDANVDVNFETDDVNVDVNFETDDVNVDVNFETDDANVDVNFETDKSDVDISIENDNTDVTVDFENTDVAVSVEVEENQESLTVEFEAIPTESYFCGADYDDASESCAIPCPMKSDDDCPGNMKCFPFTPCAKPGSFFCGQTFDEASQSCTRPCPSGKSNTCPSGEICFAYTTCKEITETPTENPTPKPTFPPVTPLPTKEPSQKPSNNPTKRPSKQPTDVPTKSPVTQSPTEHPTPLPTKTPTRHPTAFPTEHPTPFPTPLPTKNPTDSPTKRPTNTPTKSPIIPVVFDVPEDSFYCGVTFDHASQLCGVACPNGKDDCPPGMGCFGNTPCGERNSFFCGVSYGDANEKCTIPCPSGSANECPNGESCLAFTMCKPITDAPTEIPTEYPTRKPSKEPTPEPTSEPTRKPSKEPTPEPTPEPTIETEAPVSVSVMVEESDEPTYAPTAEIVAQSEQEEPQKTEAEDEEEEPEEEEKEPEEEEEEEEEESEPEEEEPEEEEEEPEPEEEETDDAPDESSALVIEIKPCDDPLAMTVNQAYWRSWSTDRPETCNRFEPSDIEDETYTHLVYSFASISSAGLVEPWVGSWDEVDKYKEFNKVKEYNPDVKTIIAVTEGIFYGAGMNPVTFREVAQTEESRIAFAQSVPAFLSLYDFDGIEIDWDSPLDPDRGGDPDNYEKLPLLMKEIRNAIEESGEEYLLTFALPPTDWELLDFDVEALAESVDWFNLMSFDYHTPKNIPKTVGAHTDLKLIDYVVTDLVKNTASTKFVLGMAAFGRTYTLADDRCKELGCPFRSPGLGGCGNTPGFLPYAEISEFIENGSYNELHQDVSSSSMVAVVDDDQLISFDDESTWAIKEAYAEMMCLRGVMLWSVDMLKAPSTESNARRMEALGERSLSSRSAADTDSIAISGEGLLGCNLCEGFKVISGNRVDYAGSEVSCAEMDSMLNTLFIEQDSDQCTDIHSTYKSQCCAKAPSKPCDICGAGKIVLTDKQVHYSGEDSTCGKLSTSFLQMMEMTSFTCSLAKTSLKNLCCAETCKMCSADQEINSLALIELDGKQVTCKEYESSLSEAGHLNESDQCASMVSSFSDVCCSSMTDSVESEQAQPAKPSCNICHRDGIHHELNGEATVQYKGASLSCVDVNSILAKNEIEGSDMCDATQSMLFDGCCYEKCSLCGDQAVKFDTTVKYNNQILSCDEFSQLFIMTVTNKGSEQCDTMQATYSETCCYKPPTTPCNLCREGSNLYELNTHAFVKTRTARSHCKALSTQLFAQEDENSEQCLASKAEYFESCCNTALVPSHQSYFNEKTWNNWIADYMAPGPSSSGMALQTSIRTLIMISVVATAFLIN